MLTLVLAGAGFIAGGTAGILKSTTPGLFATASAIQCFALGSSFWLSRGLVLQAWDVNKQTPSDRTKASTLAGGISGGACGLLFRGRMNAVAGTLVLGTFGFAGQVIANYWQALPVNDKPRQGILKSLTPEFSFMRHMSNEEYSEMLKERLLKVDVEIAVLDDKLAALKKEAKTSPATEAKPDE